MSGKKIQQLKKQKCECKKFIEYYELNYPEWTKEQCEDAIKKYKRSLNYQCIEYYENLYPNLSHEEHIKLKEQAIQNKRENSKTNILYWQKHYPEKSLEELEELRSNEAKSKNKCNLEYWINKYPQKTLEEVKELHNNHYQSWLSHQEGWGKGDKNVNSKTNSDKETRNSRSPKCIEFYQRKYPELSNKEHQKMLSTHINKVNKLLTPNKRTTNIEYYLEQGYELDEAYIKLKERQTTFTLEKCIKKHGIEKGTSLYNKRQEKWMKKLYENFQINGDGRSKQSKFALNIINEICNILNIDIPKREKYYYDKIYNRAYAYDFVFNNKIIEFNGDYWHCNPKIFSSDYFNSVKQKTAQEIWDYDKRKKECAEEYNNSLLIIWEYDYNNNKEETIKKCIDFLIS